MGVRHRNKYKNEENIEDDEIIYEEEEVVVDDSSPKSSGGDAANIWYQKYRNYLIGGVGLFAILGIWWIVSGNNRVNKNIEGQKELIYPARYYEADSIALAINGDGNARGLDYIASNFGKTEASNLAKYYLGTAKLRNGDLDGGIADLESYSKGHNMVGGAAYAALGFAYEEKGDFPTAADYYIKASKTPAENKGTTPLYLMHAGRNYESAGKRAEAHKVYKRIKEDYPTSVEANNIDVYLGRTAE